MTTAVLERVPNRNPSFGVWFRDRRAFARIWAPDAGQVALRCQQRGCAREWPLVPEGTGVFSGELRGLAAGDRYLFVLDRDRAVPDPASRSQPDGVHAASEAIDASTFVWRHEPPHLRLDETVIYELHLGTFTPEGTFDGVRRRLAWLAGLGITAVELMPVAAFPGSRNWGYDGAALFAPAAVYGRPDDLRRLVDEAHGLGLAVLLDVVYNHFGPDGAYAIAASSRFLSTRHRSPWGAGVNLDGEHAEHVREFFLDNALMWLLDYKFDGLRLDATHALVDESDRHFLGELSDTVRHAVHDRPVLLVAEDERNLRTLLTAANEGGLALDAVWADDFHHVIRRVTNGDHEGYFRDYQGTMSELAKTVRGGWLYEGAPSVHHAGPRGTSAAGLPLSAFVVCIQNHDQIGNRAFGDRLHHTVDLATWRALSTLLLSVPETPLLFMGQEWAASSPFLFFTNHEPALGQLVSQGRRKEFRQFKAFADETSRERIPDPQAIETFERSHLVWDEITRSPHEGTLALYRQLLSMRRLLARQDRDEAEGEWVSAAGENALWVRRRLREGGRRLIVVQLRGGGLVRVAAHAHGEWTATLDTELPAFVPEPAPIDVEHRTDGLRIHFQRPGAVVFETAVERRT